MGLDEERNNSITQETQQTNMKILSGSLKGRNFYMPAGIRPTKDVIRKAIFDIIGQDLEGMAFLDLFAGSGAVGLEALSRGAKRVVFVEKDPRCVGVINENLEILNKDHVIGPEQNSFVFNADTFPAIKQMNKKGEKFDFIFVDPPYYAQLAKKTLKTLLAYDIVQPNNLIIIQHEKRETLPDSEGRFLLVREKKYGGSILSILRSTPGGKNSDISGEF